jgi:hypothetical protein
MGERMVPRDRRAAAMRKRRATVVVDPEKQAVYARYRWFVPVRTSTRSHGARPISERGALLGLEIDGLCGLRRRLPAIGEQVA